MKVVVTDYIEEDLVWEKDLLASQGIEFTYWQMKTMDENEIVRLAADAEVLVVNMLPITDHLLSRLPCCKLVLRHGIGYDNVDVEACTRHGVIVANQPDYCVEDVAEHAVALIFACSRKLFPSMKAFKASCGTDRWEYAGLFPLRRLSESVLGILGLGRIGRRVATIMGSTGMRIVACDPYVKASRLNGLPVELVSLEELLRLSDIVTVHVPLNSRTKHILDDHTIGQMKQGAILVNTSRGGMVDLDALSRAVKEGRIGAVGLDVFEQEPPAALPVFAAPEVLATPHVAWQSDASAREIRKNIVEDIQAWSQGKSPRNPLNSLN